MNLKINRNCCGEGRSFCMVYGILSGFRNHIYIYKICLYKYDKYNYKVKKTTQSVLWRSPELLYGLQYISHPSGSCGFRLYKSSI